MNIYQKLSAITSELQTVAKNLTVQTSKTASYKAVSERDILDAVKPLEEKHGIYSYPVSREVLESNLLESTTEFTQGDKTTVTKKTTFMTRIKTVYRFVNVEKPDEYIETVTFAEGIDSQDKGSGKAMTYGDKYALMKAYKISTGDDPDQNASEPTDYRRARAQKLPTTIEEAKAVKIITTDYKNGIELGTLIKIDPDTANALYKNPPTEAIKVALSIIASAKKGDNQ